MLEKAIEVRDKAYSPYSQFKVGCCILTDKGSLFSGCNVENISYGLTLCAEGSAIAAMITAEEHHIAELTVISSGNEICPPCGACRQRIAEFGRENTLIHMYNNTHEKKMTYTLKELLPYSFNTLE
jgi:cytidine deaminase